ASIYSEPTNDDTRMLRSSNGGLTWQQITISDSYTYVETIGFINPMHGWTGGEGTLWETTDGGDTWQTIPLGYNYNRFIRVNDSTAYLSGSQVYKYQRDLNTGATDPGVRPMFHSLSVSPNPTTGASNIRLRLDRPTIADLRLVASDGRTVKQLLRERNAAKGEYNYAANLEGLSGSIYFVVLKSNEGMVWEKVVVQ
ncbi:MAG TPA: T9SS type A sorting domain-containing protein, partial [Flavobacteriales bacterium]|nr:T9SS type A sorting domain-containing protein [Flavobacteriales bacterium]